MGEVIVMFDAPEAAHPHTIEGWASRDGHWYHDERSARYSGCTHRPCEECGEPTPKMYLYCESCRAKRALARYEAMPEAPWDGRQMVYSEARDRYYDSPDDALDDGYCDSDEQDLTSLRLVLCDPIGVARLDTDWFADDLPEDGEAPDELLAAIDAFNAATAGLILSWHPGKHRLAKDSPHV